ncbi:NosR/NirI family protein [Oceanicella actignis]|uniref:NosR/NirI family protein n=1 Tax=Oceanicella actignis TaxID=1189325 RepID=UPI0011E7E927|nr:NosR/NirI family protein [Oceanicella actignis]TYO84568.1 NosR/NirI family nitrous oxide reductase transcriptional regulator [Oceanicella actignis]
MPAKNAINTIVAVLCSLARCLVWLGVLGGTALADTSVLPTFLKKVAPSEVVAGADAWGPIQGDLPVAPILKDGKPLGRVFVTSDFVSTIGYSGKPIHVMVALNDDAKIIGARLVEHHEPIVLVGIPNSRMVALTESYVGADMAAEAARRGSAHELEIVSGATVTVMIIDDSILRASVKVARALGLGGLTPEVDDALKFEINPDASVENDWMALLGDGTVRRLSLDVGQVNAAFEAMGDPRAASRPAKGAPDERFIDMYVALVSAPQIGRALLGEHEYANQERFLNPGDHAILVAGRGMYSFKGSGYVRGGIFDRIALVQGDITVRFHDRDHRRIGALAASGSPEFSELDIFRIPADSGFDPTKPWKLQLLVQRAVGPVEKVFTTFELGYRLPDRFLREVRSEPAAGAAPVEAVEDEQAARAGLWKRIWLARKVEIAALLGMIGVLTGVFFFQVWATRNERIFFWFRMGFLSLTLVFIGWLANAQISVVNLLALFSSLRTGFTWEAFLMDPLVFIIWCSVAAALIFWARGAFCGWLCPFGALQELTNRVARALHVPQIKVPWGLHERLWALKYIIFLALFGLSVISLSLAERYAEVEPFKTAIVLKFARPWPFVLFAVILLAIGLFIERFYCRYLCPLGGALAIPARIRMFDWLKRYRECGNPCHVCANECPVQAIHPTGEINPNECISCLHCQVLYQSKAKCPVVIKQLKRRERDRAALEAAKGKLDEVLAGNHKQNGAPR